MKRTICVLLAFLFLISFSASAENVGPIISDFNKHMTEYVPEEYENNENIFSDIIDVNWAQESIYALADLKIISGVGDNRFAPEDSVTKSQFLKMVFSAAGLLDEDAKTDKCSENNWQYPYIASAEKYGFDKLFYNDDYSLAISREEMAASIGYALGLMKIKADFQPDVLFSDDENIDLAKKKYVYMLKNLYIISGYENGTFMPKNTARRCEAAVIVYKFVKYIDDQM